MKDDYWICLTLLVFMVGGALCLLGSQVCKRMEGMEHHVESMSNQMVVLQKQLDAGWRTVVVSNYVWVTNVDNYIQGEWHPGWTNGWIMPN